jgi:RNA polymerase sigma factor (sigma-70 family)
MKDAASLEMMAPEQDRRISDVVAREQSRLRSFIRRRVPDPRDAEDILQDVFYELVEANRLLMPIDHITGWLFRVARNRITDLFRKKKPERFSESATADENGDRLRLEDLCHRPTRGRRRSTPAPSCWRNSNWRSTNCRRSSATCSSRTKWKAAASRRWPPRPA